MKSKLDASTNVLAAETKSESMTDEKMQEVTKELLNIRISQMDVGKAVEICYRDPVERPRGMFSRQTKEMGQTPETNKAICEEVEKLVNVGIMKEVHYHNWL
ncbi:hypothetical protein Tco_1097336, partial [Tanacetum coccineum]